MRHHEWNYTLLLTLKPLSYETEMFTQNDAPAMRPRSRQFECVGR